MTPLIWIAVAVGAFGCVCFTAAGALALKAFGGAGTLPAGHDDERRTPR